RPALPTRPRIAPRSPSGSGGNAPHVAIAHALARGPGSDRDHLRRPGGRPRAQAWTVAPCGPQMEAIARSYRWPGALLEQIDPRADEADAVEQLHDLVAVHLLALDQVLGDP